MRKTKSPKIKMVSKALAERIGKQCKQYKAERDTLIDDIAVLRANEKRYRTRAENAMDLAERANCEVLRLEDENERLRNNYNALTQHIRQKAEANPNVNRYIALVNFIDRLESK